MLKELFDAISDKAVEANGVKVLQVAAEPAHKYYLCTPDQAPRLVEAAPKPRDHKALSLNAVERLVKDSTEDGKTVAVWYSSKAIIGLLDDETRRDRVTLDLLYSKQLQDLISLESNPIAYDLAKFRKLLRVNLVACLSRCPNLVGLIERVKFATNSEQTEQIKHGVTSVGKKLEQSLTATGDLPEYVDLDVPIFVGEFDHLRGVVRCALEPDAGTQTFKLIPLPGQLSAAIRGAEEMIQTTLAESLPDTVAILHGTP